MSTITKSALLAFVSNLTTRVEKDAENGLLPEEGWGNVLTYIEGDRLTKGSVKGDLPEGKKGGDLGFTVGDLISSMEILTPYSLPSMVNLAMGVRAENDRMAMRVIRDTKIADATIRDMFVRLEGEGKQAKPVFKHDSRRRVDPVESVKDHVTITCDLSTGGASGERFRYTFMRKPVQG